MKHRELKAFGVVIGLLLFSSVEAITCDASYPYRSYDGTCNNLNDPFRGSSNTFYARGPEGAEYADNISIPVIRPNERTISNKISRIDPAEQDYIPHSLFSVMFGQFVNHDIDGNRFADGGAINQFIPILETNDPFCSCINASGILDNCCLHPRVPAPRVAGQSSGGQIINGRFEIFNNVSSYLDLSQVYSNSATVNQFLRTLTGGKMLLQNYTGVSQLLHIPFSFTDILPSYTATGSGNVPTDSLNFPPAANFPTNELFVSGDERVGENVVLGMFHLLFTREHNRIADQLAALHPTWNDEKLFQESRKLNIAQYQNIVFYEFLVNEFGLLPFFRFTGHYTGYDSSVKVATPILFASAAFRYGHATIAQLFAVNKCGNTTLLGFPTTQPVPFNGVTGGPFSPIDSVMFFTDYETAIRGIVDVKTHSVSVRMEDLLRNIVFNGTNGGGGDLMAVDLLRGRINGLPNYVTVRKAYNIGGYEKIYGTLGCPASLENSNANDPLPCFKRVTSNQTLAQQLQQVYGKVNKMDAFVGMLAETPRLLGSSFASTISNIILSHFRDLRDGDRFWFENPGQFSWFQLLEIKTTSMAELLRRNFKDLVIPDNVFITPEDYRATLADSDVCLN